MARAKRQQLETALYVPSLVEWEKVQWVIIAKNERWVLIACSEWSFVWVIIPKEAKDLERNNVDLSAGREVEVEIVSTEIIHEEWYYIVSITRLLQHDVWNNITAKSQSQEIITVIPTEANLGGLLIDMHGIKWFIPLSQLAPVNYPRVEDGDQEKIFDKLVWLIGKEFKVRVLDIDEENRRVILSEREAMKEQREKIINELAVGKMFDAIISWTSTYWLFVAIEWIVEWLVHISEITYWHVDSIDRFGKVGQNIRVKVISLDNGKISLSMKQIKEDPWKLIPEKFSQWDTVQGEIIRFVPYGAFMRIFDDINGLIHLNEITDEVIHNPAEVIKLWQVVKAKLITLDPKYRKIGLSMRALICEDKWIPYEISTQAKQMIEWTHKNNYNNNRTNTSKPPFVRKPKSLDDDSVKIETQVAQEVAE